MPYKLNLGGYKTILYGLGTAVKRLFLNGTNQRVTMPTFTLQGANFTGSVTVEPTGDPSSTEILTDFLTVNASGNPVLTYTDTAALSQTCVLTGLVMSAGNEYPLSVVSDGNGVALSGPEGQEVVNNPALDSAWSFNDGVYSYINDGSSVFIDQGANSLIPGRKYRCKFTLYDKLGPGSVGFSTTSFVEGFSARTLSSNGDFDGVLTARSAAQLIFFTNGDGSGKVSGLSVKEVHEDTNAAVIDPATVAIDQWGANAAASGAFFPGRISDVVLSDAGLASGNYLQPNGVDLYATTPLIQFSHFRVTFKMQYYSGNYGGLILGSRPPGDPVGTFYVTDLRNGNLEIRVRSSSGNHDVNLSGLVNGLTYLLVVELDLSNTLKSYLDGKLVNTSLVTPGTTYNFDSFFDAGPGGFGPSSSIVGGALIENLNTGDTYEYKLNNIVDNGDGTGTAPNTGSTGSAFDGTVYNYDPLTDLTAIANDSRSYPVKRPPDAATLADTVNGEDAAVQNYDVGMWQ